METQFVWQEEFNIGVETIDREHQQLFKIINKLYALRKAGKDNRWVCQESIKFFRNHALNHFADEEAYMTSIAYEGLVSHKRIHQGFRENTLPILEQELERTDYSPEAVDHFLGVCAGWLIGHTLTEDQAIAGKQIRRWENLLPEEEQTAMEKVILQLIFDLFHLESHLVSGSYGGEKFGKGVYYHLVYGREGDEKNLEVLMVFEDNTLINTVGKVMGIQTNKLDDMLIHAARYTARQFVVRVMEHFPALDGFELREENLLFYDQFSKIFQRETMQTSLLFDTGAGYFAFCLIAPHLLKKGVGTPIQHENAMTEVEEYLARRKIEDKQASKKPKILVVDDSATILQGMKTLLEQDYQVTAVNSGVAAIHAITLDRPDLVLLDYEMPICDGKQMLEMLRSLRAYSGSPSKRKDGQGGEIPGCLFVVICVKTFGSTGRRPVKFP